MQTYSSLIKKINKIALLLAAAVGIGFAGSAVASVTGIPLSQISSNVGSSVSSGAGILVDVSIIAGIGFIMASFFKFHQHKLNPTQVPLSQGLTLLLIGAGLMVFPTLVPTASKAVFGSAQVAKVGGAGLKGLIGSSFDNLSK